MADNNPFKTILAWVTGLGSIALFLLIMLILFGNLSGNTGFDDSTSTLTITNESISWVNATGVTLSGYNSTWSSITATTSYNASDDTGFPIANISISATGVVTNATAGWFWEGDDSVDLCYTYLQTYTSTAEENAESLITDYTTSATNTSAQFPTVGTILGIAVLLFILVAVAIYAMKKFSTMGGGSGSGSFEGRGGSFA